MEFFNEGYINIMEKSWGKKPSSVGKSDDSPTDEFNVKEINSAYSSSILRIKNDINLEKSFELPETNRAKINNIIQIDKATGPDGISPIIVKMSANVNWYSSRKYYK